MSRYTLNDQTKVILNTTTKRRYFSSLLPIYIEPTDKDIYVITTEGDRLDKLAFQYYDDATLWWIIVSANPTLRKDSLYIEPGAQIRIPDPNDLNAILNTFITENTNR
jgi:nucleoid-associated protein YgaU